MFNSTKVLTSSKEPPSFKSTWKRKWASLNLSEKPSVFQFVSFAPTLQLSKANWSESFLSPSNKKMNSKNNHPSFSSSCLLLLSPLTVSSSSSFMISSKLRIWSLSFWIWLQSPYRLDCLSVWLLVSFLPSKNSKIKTFSASLPIKSFQEEG